MVSPTFDYRRTDHRIPSPPLAGLDALVNGVIGGCKRRAGAREVLMRDAVAVDALALKWMELTDAALQERLLELRAQFRRGGRAAEGALLPALAAIREAADRKTGMRPFLVQLMGALALHRGYLAEMATGEGKTLTAGLAAILAGWTKRPCHVITVNDYLVQRDAEWLESLYHFCGVRVGFVAFWMGEPERTKGYGCDVTYVTSKELLADFLRDRIRLGALRNPTRRFIHRLLSPLPAFGDGLVMRGLHTAIVDEADSVLIDEAVTPLIIAAPHKNDALRDAVLIAHEMSGTLRREDDYRLTPRYREIELTGAGARKLADQASSLPGFWRGNDRRLEIIIQALVAREFYHRDKQYIVEGDKLVIVDEFTGRPMPQRTWREGMHQAIEAKENIPISDPTETIARLSFQRFFRCFHRLAGMTGTAREAAAELWHIYRLPVIGIPPNKPCVREHWPDAVFADEATKWRAVAEEVRRLHATGRPVLVGTRSVHASEHLARLLGEHELDCQVLNAARLQEEAAAVAMAGECGRITIATNMAGRGTDIKLGRGAVQLGGLHVLATERHESGRVDRQLFGRAARQGDPGSCQAFVSMEDELVRRHLPARVCKLLNQAVRNRWGGWRGLVRVAFASAQRRAQKQAFQQRQGVLRSDTWLEESLSFAGSSVV